jgi:hypothetical protein
MIHSSKGIIQYDPYRPGLKKKKDWWCVLNIDADITRYYRWWAFKEMGVELNKPSWGSHVSIIRGEKPFPNNMDLWKKYNGLEVEFTYSSNVRQAGDRTGLSVPSPFWFIDVECDFLIDIRKEMGFPYDYGLHLTIGRTN